MSEKFFLKMVKDCNVNLDTLDTFVTLLDVIGKYECLEDDAES